METYNARDKEWDALGLNYDGLEMSFFNQQEDGFDTLRGEWFSIEDDCKRLDGIKVVYGGTFGNYNSPGASDYTWAEVYQADEHDAFYARVKYLVSLPEYLDTEDEESEDEEAIDADEE